MVRLYFYVEGQTEQEYVRRVLMPYLAGFGVQVMGAVLARAGQNERHERHRDVFDDPVTMACQ